MTALADTQDLEPIQRRWLVGLAGLGILDATYLWAAHAAGHQLACPEVGWISCDAVVSSRYSTVLGLPLAVWGLAGYLSVLVLALWRPLSQRVTPAAGPEAAPSAMPLVLLRVLTAAMATVGFFLVYLMLGVLHAICLYCLGSFVLSISLFAVSNFWPGAGTPRTSRGQTLAAGVVVGALALAGFGASPGATSGYLQLVPPTYPIPYSSGPAEMALASWLTAHGARMYGGYRCPHCFREKCLFGRQAFALIHYVECDPSTSSARLDLCRAAHIREFPTWEIGGRYYPGEANLERLAQLSGYRGDVAFARHIALSP